VCHPLILIDANELRVECANQAFYQFSSTRPEDLIGRPVYEICDALLGKPEVKPGITDVATTGRQFQGLEIRAAGISEGARFFASGRRLELELGAPPRILLALESVAPLTQQAA